MSQTEKAEKFHSLHAKGNPLVLYNIWDAGGAKVLAKAGSQAVATGSWAVAAAQGYPDGHAIPLDFVLRIVERITATVDVPVSVDFEGGYAIDPGELKTNIQKLIQAGAIGINFEDQVVGTADLHPIALQVERIKAIREAADSEGVPLFINARTDTFLKADAASHESVVANAIEREAAYAEAGASGFFIPGLTQLPLIEQVVAAASLPVNVMIKGDLSTVGDAAKAGASRVSFGPGSYVNAMADITERFTSIK